MNAATGAGPALQHGRGLRAHPRLGDEEAPGRLPQVLEHMDEIDGDRHGHLAGLASAPIRAIWWLLPSTMATQGR